MTIMMTFRALILSNFGHVKTIKMANYTVDRGSLKQRLTPLQYSVTQLADTEKAFSGKYDKFFMTGIYSCVVCSEDLFSSETKYDSGCGWPSFFDSLDKSKFKFTSCYKKAPRIRTEVTCAKCQAHLGHIFQDGPMPTKQRFCINSAAMNFRIPEDSSALAPESVSL